MLQSCPNCSKIENPVNGVCETCSTLITAFNRYYAANIPLDYWHLQMSSFKGAPNLKKFYDDAINHIQDIYNNGQCFIFAGNHGCGKTLTVSNILKRCCHKNYSCFYTTLSDIVSALIEAPYEDRYYARKELLAVDFLAIDEFDPRFVNPSASDLFGKTFENIMRTRQQNGMPVFLCSNSPNPNEMFSGSLKESIGSIMSKVKTIVALGSDYRKNGESK